MDGGPGEAPGDVWLRFKGVPLYVWREGVFKLLGDCVGQTLEVDHRTIQQEDLFYGRVEVLLDDTRELPEEISLWLDDIQVPVKVEVEQLEPQRKGYSQNWSDIMNGGLNRPIQDLMMEIKRRMILSKRVLAILHCPAQRRSLKTITSENKI